MKNRRFSIYMMIGFLFGSSVLLGSQNTKGTVIKRFLIVIGANNGGAERVQLKYAVSDAESVRKVFHDLGGVMKGDSLFLADPDLKTFYTKIERFRLILEEARSEHSRLEVIFYYSGHSDGDNILIGEEIISYKNLRDTIQGLEADVRIVILDSCASGAFTRAKGGKKRQPFLLDEAYNMKGTAVLTSSASDEFSQESDLIKASFFTHYLISGMRGAADMSQDGRVTLNEAYQFAFSETLAQTTKSARTPQHPHYDIEMSGTGDVIMTDIRQYSTKLVLSEDIYGRLFIHDKREVLAVELSKTQGTVIEIGLEAGEYRIVNIPEEEIYESQILLESGKSKRLDPEDFLLTDRQYTTPRGDRYRQLKRQRYIGGFNARPITSNVSMQTGSTLNKREFTIGLGSIGYGISDRIQLGTNVLVWLLQVYNVDLKVAVIKKENLSAAFGLSMDYFNLEVLREQEGFTAYSPFVALSPKISDRFRMHFGARYTFFTGNKDIKDSEITSTVMGTSIYTGLEYNVSNTTKFLADAGYDTTFNGMRLSGAVLFGWKKFRFKLGVQYFKPRGFGAFTIPVIGLWWRFGG